MRKILKDTTVVLLAVFVITAANAFAGDVIIKQGSIDANDITAAGDITTQSLSIKVPYPQDSVLTFDTDTGPDITITKTLSGDLLEFSNGITIAKDGIDLQGATTENIISFTDSVTDALSFKDASPYDYIYMQFNSYSKMTEIPQPLHFHDNVESLFGAATYGDASIYYDGTDLVIDSKLVGTGGVKINGGTIYTPTSDNNITAGTGVTAAMILSRIVRVAGSGGAVTITATPNVADMTDGQIVIFQGTDDTNTVTFQDESNLANSALALSGGADMTLGQGDMLTIMYDLGDDKWYEISSSDN